ncbi:unnamed protein product, partial [Timema podura]|nr:unnamed protein product [Timema podura]
MELEGGAMVVTNEIFILHLIARLWESRVRECTAMVNIGINGFGRIGRMVLRCALEDGSVTSARNSGIILLERSIAHVKVATDL